MCNTQHKYWGSWHMVQKGQSEGWLKIYLFLSSWEKVHICKSGCLGWIQKVHALPGRSSWYCSKNQQWSPCCHIWFNFTSSHTNNFSRRGVVTTGVRTAAAAVMDLKAKWALAGGWAAETHFGHDIKVSATPRHCQKQSSCGHPLTSCRQSGILVWAVWTRGGKIT